MIIQRKLYSSSQLSPEEQIKKLKNMTPAQRYSTIGITTVAGAAPGLLLRSGKLAAIGGALGAGAGLYFTSKHSRDKQIKKLEQEIENRKKLSQSYVNNLKSEKRKELQDIKKEYGSILPKEYFTLFELSIDIDEPSVGDGDEYCTINCADEFDIEESLSESDNECIEYLVGSSSQGQWYDWDIKKKSWFNFFTGKRVINFKQQYKKDFQDNLKEVQGQGKPRSGYDTWEQWERDEVSKYLEKVIKQLKQRL